VVPALKKGIPFRDTEIKILGKNQSQKDIFRLAVFAIYNP
jgi:hypothetical protein